MICPKCGIHINESHCMCGFDVLKDKLLLISTDIDEILPLYCRQLSIGAKTVASDNSFDSNVAELPDSDSLKKKYETIINYMTDRLLMAKSQNMDGSVRRREVLFGHYYRTNREKLEPLRWLVLEKDKDSMLLITKEIIDADIFDSRWRTSEIRKWLNTKFLSVAFTEEELERILYTYHDNAVSIDRHVSDDISLSELEVKVDPFFRGGVFDKCENIVREASKTVKLDKNQIDWTLPAGYSYASARKGMEPFVCDRVFLLSEFEALYYFPNKKDRKASETMLSMNKSTEGLLKLLRNMGGQGYGLWWLRDGNGHEPEYVDSSGRTMQHLAYFQENERLVAGLRPAIWIKAE